MAKWRVVLKSGDEFEIEAAQASEKNGAVTFFDEIPVQGSAFPSRNTVASYASGQWVSYSQPDKVKPVETDPGFGVV